MESDSQKPIIEQQKKANGGLKKYLPAVWEFVKIAAIALLIVLPVRYFLFQPFIVSGASMVPSFNTGDYLIIDEISYRFSSPQRGDVVVFDASFISGYNNQRFIKRIVGLPGETVNVSNGQVDIIKDGKTTTLKEDYLPDDLKTYGDKNITLGADQYFVLGDNRQYSYDSRIWGVVDRRSIIGKAFLRILPVTSLSKISRPTY